MTRPPDDNGGLVMTGEAEGGRGFLFTVVTRDVWAWNAENESTGVLERAEDEA